MLAISVEFLHGTFRGDPRGTAGTGGLLRGEWPPAPARLFAAMVASDGTRDRCRVTNGTELGWLEQLPAPVIRAHGSAWHQPLRPRYVVRAERGYARRKRRGEKQKTSAHLEYIGRAGAEVRPGVRVTPRDPRVVYLWDAVPAPEIVSALRRRAARIGYLGTADSPVRIRVQTTIPESAMPADVFVPDPQGDVEICVPQKGDVGRWDRMYDDWMERGPSVSRAQFPALRHEARYRSPNAGTAHVDRGGVVAWLRLETAVSGRRVSTVTALFKKAVLKAHQELYGEPPPILHGHGFEGRGYELARFLALPDVGRRWSRGRIHGLALWVPPGCDRATRSRVRDAANSLRRLWGGGVNVNVQPHVGEKRPVAVAPGRWTGREGRHWVTAFPAVHERRVPLDLDEVSRWCIHAGLPRPVAFRSSRSPLVSGGVDLAPVEVNRRGRPGRPYSHLELWLAEPVRGPVVIGAARQRGLGLCTDVPHGEVSHG